jgi:large subunit ribosomal protein L35Ae
MLMSHLLFGTIVNYRIGPRSQMSRWCLIQIIHESAATKPDQLIGRRVVLKYGENSFTGRIMRPHGKKGLVTAKFRRGIPGQAIGARVELPG